MANADRSRQSGRIQGRGGANARRHEAARHEIVLTQRGTASAVVQDFDAYQRRQNALLMLKLIVQGGVDIRAGRTTSQDRVFAEIRDRLTRPDDG